MKKIIGTLLSLLILFYSFAQSAAETEIRKLEDAQREAFERVTFKNNIAIYIGNETLHSTGKMPNAGKTVKRIYTNIWMKNKTGWLLVARQATIIRV